VADADHRYHSSGGARQTERKKMSVMDGRIDPDRDIYAIPSQVY
jgi:hypothetical protein